MQVLHPLPILTIIILSCPTSLEADLPDLLPVRVGEREKQALLLLLSCYATLAVRLTADGASLPAASELVASLADALSLTVGWQQESVPLPS